MIGERILSEQAEPHSNASLQLHIAHGKSPPRMTEPFRSAAPRITLAELRAGGNVFNYRSHAIFTHDAGLPNAPALLLVHNC
jgi:hypothetical protein